VLHELHRRVVESTELVEVFDTKPINKSVIRKGVPVKLKDDTLWTRKQLKWDRFVGWLLSDFWLGGTKSQIYMLSRTAKGSSVQMAICLLWVGLCGAVMAVVANVGVVILLI